MSNKIKPLSIARRFRNFLPVVIDVETGGFNSQKDALLEIAAVLLQFDKKEHLQPTSTHACHVLPFPGANIEAAALAVNHIDPYHPFRFALNEAQALQEIFMPIEMALKQHHCERAILVGHNANFDLSFIQAAAARCKIPNPFHSFVVFDTATLSALAFGETVLARAAKAAGINFDREQAHSAIYDAERTAELFCLIINRWHDLGGWIR